MRAKMLIVLVTCGLVGLSFYGSNRASDAVAPKFDREVLNRLVERGTSYLLTTGQAPDGSYSAQVSPAVTAICTTALLRSGRSPDEPAIAKSLKYLEGFAQDDGGIYKPDSNTKNYETAIAIMCFAEANKDGRYKKLIADADTYIKRIQWGGDGKLEKSDLKYGGAGYGSSGSRPDLSNTSFLIDALRAAGNSADDEAVQRAVVFVSRCQNLKSQYNTTAFADKNPDGGFYYTCADNGKSAPGGTSDDGGLRSYGSMTYAGLKSMIFAGLGPSDERVKAAIDWIGKNYDLTTNPGLGQRGLFYGYHTFAKALAALGQEKFMDSKGDGHNWRGELIAELAKRQKEDGSWVNSDKNFMEGDPNLVTAYSLLALSYCQPNAK
jgi:squalene-hopene/tetraprenyl-beta-curcumene cyclase